MTSNFTKTLRIKVKPSSWSWLNAAAVEVNQVWNWANETTAKAWRPFSGKPRWLTSFDINNLSAGACEYFENIGADVVQQVSAEHGRRRKQFKRGRLRWRASHGSRRSLGWVPFKAVNIRRTSSKCILRFQGKSIRLFEPLPDKWMGGQFSQDALGQWWICLPVQLAASEALPGNGAVGVDLGLKSIAVTSDSESLQAGNFYRGLEQKIAQAQRRGHKRQAKHLHHRATNLRRNALHQFSRRIVDRYQFIVVGDVSSSALAKTRMAKAVLDSGWGELKTQLQYKGEYAGRCVRIVSERNTTRACSSCGSLSGPRGCTGLAVRQWVCSACGAEHDRDVNAARNILTVGLRHGPPLAGTRGKPGCRSEGAEISNRRAPR